VAWDMSSGLDAFSGGWSSRRYHLFLLQTAPVSSRQNAGVALPDERHRAVIAVVDDDQGILESIDSLLDSADYEVRLFASATALLDSGALAEIDCLISDVAMPLMDGFELARTVQAARPALPVIMITGRPDLLHRAPLQSPGSYRVFKKPFDGQELLTAVALMLRSPRLPRS
jgi:FixJ family two-component response regulator